MNAALRSGPRYLGGALLCAGINNVILIAGARLGVPDTVSVLLTWLIGGSAGYLWHALVTFRERVNLRRYARFMTGIAIGTPVAWLLVMLFRQGLGWSMEVTAPVTTVLMVVYNYANARTAIRRRQPRLPA